MSVPMAVYGLSVSPEDGPIPAEGSIPGAFRITMAAIDPSETAQGDAATPYAVLKLIRQPLLDIDSDDESDFDEEEMDALLAENDSDNDSEESDEAGDDKAVALKPTLSKKALAKKLRETLEADNDVDMTNGVDAKKSKSKSKSKTNGVEEEDDDEEAFEEFVICTLDPTKTMQQTLDITVGVDEEVYFKVDGTHTVHLTGNYVEPPHSHDDEYDSEDDEEDDDDYGMYPTAEDLDSDVDEDEEEDELDDMADPRVTEVASDDDAPALVSNKTKKAADKKGKNKRAAEDSDDAPADEPVAKDTDAKLSKKQQKKLKANDGKAVPTTSAADTPDKKVQFAEKLVQGPTSSTTAEKSKPTVVQGVTIDDKKIGTGRAAKKGDKAGMRYIGKLQKNNQVFDSNKKGKPFTVSLGKGEVIKGWEIGIAGMQVGGERRITIPPHLAYGSSKTGSIPANSTLVFDLKMVDLK